MAARWWRLRAARLRAAPAELASEEARIEQRRQAQAARLRRLQRLMEPSGPPERALSRQAIALMRYLRLESPEEWPVARLARSFQVDPCAVGRILRSRFSPSPERARKQNKRLPLPGRAGAEAPPPQAAQRKSGGGASPPGKSSHPQRRSAEPPARGPQPRLRVVQKGREFVDEDGNLLYRIPA